MSGLRPEERFSNLERIGRGSFGAVYRCTDIVSRDTVAVKIIDLEQAEDEIDDIQQVRPLTRSAAPVRQRHTAQEGFCLEEPPGRSRAVAAAGKRDLS